MFYTCSKKKIIVRMGVRISCLRLAVTDSACCSDYFFSRSYIRSSFSLTRLDLLRMKSTMADLPLKDYRCTSIET